MRVTLRQIAEETNTSLATTSLIINNKPVRVSPSTKQKVLETARKYNYQPNRVAQSLVTKKSMTVGFVVPDISNSFFAEIAKNVEVEFSKKGYNLILCNTNEREDLQRQHINNLLSRGIDALIICLSQQELDEGISQLNSLEIPCVAFDRWTETITCTTISVDNELGAQYATSHLVERGHTKIGCITGNLSGVSARRRFDGYKTVLQSNNITYDHRIVYEGNYQYDSGYSGGKKLISNGVTAIFACNDLMAFGVLEAAKELGVAVPSQLSVVGFDDLFFSQIAETPLTTVRQPIVLLSESIAKHVFLAIEGQVIPEQVLLAPQLIVRKSSGLVVSNDL